MTRVQAAAAGEAWWRSSHLASFLVPISALSLGLATLGQRVLAIPDAAFHLLQGRIVLERGLPEGELLAFTSHDGPWLLQSWLVDALWAAVERVGGLPLLHALLVATVIGVYLLLGALVWRRAPGWATPVLMLIVTFAASSHLTLRPSLLSVAFLVATWAIARGWASWWWALPLFALWSNVHGAFLVGIVLVLAVIVGEAMERVWGRGDRGPQLRHAGSVLGAAILGGLLTPYGPRLWAYLFQLARIAPGEITEWSPPVLTTPHALGFLAVFGLVLFSLARESAPDLADVTVTLLALAITMAASRNATAGAALVVVAGAPYVHRLIHDARPDPGGDGRRRPTSVLVLALTVLSAVLVSAPPLTRGDESALHVRPGIPIDLIEQLPAGSRVFTNSVIGPFVSLLRWPDVRIAYDGRVEVYPLERFRDMREILLGMPNWSEQLQALGASHVIVVPGDGLAEALVDAPGWAVVTDGADGAVLYERSASSAGAG